MVLLRKEVPNRFPLTADSFLTIMKLPTLQSKLTKEHLGHLTRFSWAVRHDILAMTTNAQSGHPGGSLGCADYLSLLYSFLVGQTGDPVIVSNGHISPAVYAVLAQMGYVDRADVVEGFRKIGQPYEGHVTRHVPGVWYGTGPLGAGAGAASGFALADALLHKKNKRPVYCIVGDGESQEGQVYEMMHVAAKYQLNNLILFMDYNQVQLTDSLDAVMPYDPAAHFKAAGWNVITVNGHDYQAIWKALGKAHKSTKPTLLLGKTIMGKGVSFMEETGKKHQATWHGKTASPADAAPELERLQLSDDDEAALQTFRATHVAWHPEPAVFGMNGNDVAIKTGTPIVYDGKTLTDCRSAYGAALLDLVKQNDEIVALTADLAGSVKTDGVKKEVPDRHIDVGVAEQEMVSCAGGMSLAGMIPFCSTFGAFMTSRAKDQARVNDINEANVKMVATHCGLSVGEDGPTHQAIDDSGSVLGFFNTMQMEPADPNQCDRMIRFAASHYGNVYIRMGRHKIPVLTKEDGSLLFGADYEYYYGRCDLVRSGTDITVAAMGATVCEAVEAAVKAAQDGISVEVIAVSSIKQFDTPLFDSIRKTTKVLTVEDHTTRSGLGSQLAHACIKEGIQLDEYISRGVDEYALSGTAAELYAAAGIDADGIVHALKTMMGQV